MRSVFKDKLDIVQDEDFITHRAADRQRVNAYNTNPVPGSGPDINNIQFDLGKDIKTAWNMVLFHHFCDIIDQRRAKDGILPKREVKDVMEMVINRFKSLKGLWTKAQPKQLVDGDWETLEEAEQRYVEASVSRRDVARRNSRQVTVTYSFAFSKQNSLLTDL